MPEQYVNVTFSEIFNCSLDVTLEVNVIVSRVPNATELAQIAAAIASYLGVDPSRVHIDVQYDGSNVVLVITIIGRCTTRSIR